MAESIAKLRWACRRGMLELDVLLLNFLEKAYPQLPLADQIRFAELLTYPDPNLFSWLLGSEPVPVELGQIVNAIKQCKIKVLD